MHKKSGVEFSYFASCSALCREGLRPTLVYVGASLGEGKSGVTVGIVTTKVACRECAGQTFSHRVSNAVLEWWTVCGERGYWAGRGGPWAGRLPDRCCGVQYVKASHIIRPCYAFGLQFSAQRAKGVPLANAAYVSAERHQFKFIGKVSCVGPYCWGPGF